MDVKRSLPLRGLLLGAGLLFHAVLLPSLEQFAPRRISFEGAIPVTPVFLSCYAVLMLMTVFALLRRRAATGISIGLLAALCVLPPYMLAFARHWQLGLIGILFSLLQAWLFIHAGHQPIHAEEEVSWLDSSAGTDAVLWLDATLVVVVSLISGYHVVVDPVAVVSVWLLIALTVGMSLLYERHHESSLLRFWLNVRQLILFLALACVWTRTFHEFALPLIAARQILTAIKIWLQKRGGQEFWHYLSDRPASLLLITFGLAIGVGALLLSLPAAASGEHPLSAVDALFMATSATCVTGLIVVDTGGDLSLFGQLIVLALFQAGGLGIMTLSTFIALALGRNIGLRSEFSLKEVIGEQRTRTALRLLRFIVLITVVLESVGAAILCWRFLARGESMPRAIFLGIFHSVSAFCNAGFALFSDSLVGLADDPVIPLTVSILIVVGGLGFGVLFAPLHSFGRRLLRNLHVRIVLVMTFLLAFGGTLIIWLLEQPRAFADSSAGQAVLHSWFQSVTARTAGFNTIDLNTFAPVTQMVITVLMFIGAAPGSTGGGVKVTSLLVLLLVIRAVLLGRDEVTYAGRRVEQATVLSATALVCLSILLLLAAAVLLVLTQGLAARSLVFEAVSAFGTVGLSLGVTSQLNTIGKIAIILLMFIGRVGPLTLLILMRPATRSRVQYPLANVMIG